MPDLMAEVEHAQRGAADATVVDRIARDIARQILTGRLPAHARLPSVRRLAELYDVNASTVQRVLARLEAQRMVVTRPRSGATVADTRRSGSIHLLPITLEALIEEPARAAKLLGDYFEVRRILAVAVLERIAARPDAIDPEPLEQGLAALEALAAAQPLDPAAFAFADLELNRALLEQIDQTAILSLFNLIEEIAYSNEVFVEAMYQDPTSCLTVWRGLLEMLRHPELGVDSTPHVLRLLEDFDRRTVDAFERALRRRI